LSVSIRVFAVRRTDQKGRRRVVSAWVDEYSAKFEAERWSQDFKEDWDHVPATLVLEEGDGDTDPE
jgi:hypothetical protein